MGQVELPAMAVSETFMKPSSMLYRNFLAMQVRRVSLCRPFCRSKAVILQAILQVGRLSVCWQPLLVAIESPAQGRGGVQQSDTV